MSQKSVIEQKVREMDKSVRNFCRTQKSRWKQLLLLAQVPENKFLAREMPGMEVAASKGLYKILINHSSYAYVDLNTGNLVAGVNYRLPRSQALLIADNLNLIDAQSVINKAEILIRKQTKRSQRKTLPQAEKPPL